MFSFLSSRKFWYIKIRWNIRHFRSLNLWNIRHFRHLRHLLRRHIAFHFRYFRVIFITPAFLSLIPFLDIIIVLCKYINYFKIRHFTKRDGINMKILCENEFQTYPVVPWNLETICKLLCDLQII